MQQHFKSWKDNSIFQNKTANILFKKSEEEEVYSSIIGGFVKATNYR